MSPPVDLYTGLQNGVVAALAPAKAAIGSAAIYSAPPVNAQPPYWIVAGMDGEDLSGKAGDQFERMTIEVHGVIRGTSRDPLLAMMHQARLALDNELLAVDGMQFSPLRYVRSGISAAGTDGVTYASVLIYETLGQPA